MKKKFRSSRPDPFVMTGTFKLEPVFKIRISVFGKATVVVVVEVVVDVVVNAVVVTVLVVIAGQIY